MKGLQFVLHVSVVLLQAHHHQCQSTEPDEPPVPTIKGEVCESFEENHYFRTQCTSATAAQLRTDFDYIFKGAKRIINLSIRESDISGLLVYKNFFDLIKKLQLDSVTIGDLTLPELLSNFPDLEFLMVGNIKEEVTLKRETFTPGQPIKTLILIQNRLTDEDIDTDAFENIKDTLESLVLRENELTHLPSAVTVLLNLSFLDLSRNPITHFSDEQTHQFRSLTNLKTVNINDLECHCDQLRDSFYTYVREKGISMVMCSELSQFPAIPVSKIDVEESCKSSNPNPEANEDKKPDGGSQIKVAVVALIVPILPLFLK